jgi:enoyl-CoA hydratase/carnithine racemase
MTDQILMARDGAIATVTINNPDRLNAISMAMWARIGEVMSALSAEDDLRCIVVRGAGGKAFAAGADISNFETERGTPEQAAKYHATINLAMEATLECRHPVVALIDGVCVGGGLEFAAACDIRICGEGSRFGVPIKWLGVTMNYGELKCLLDLVGPAVAREILLEGDVFGAQRAKEMGLVNRIVADDKVEEEAYATAGRIAAGAPLAARWNKKFIRRLLDPRPLTPEEDAESYAAMDTEDYKIGVEAFLAKRRPEFKGR